MSFAYITTAGFLPRDIRQHRNPYLPKPKQRPCLEVPRDRRS